MVTGLASSAVLITMPFFSAVSRRRSRYADTRVWPHPAQYSGGRPGFSAGAAGRPHPGYLHAGRTVVLTVVVLPLVIGPPKVVPPVVSGRVSFG